MTAANIDQAVARSVSIDELPSLFDGVIKLARSELGILAFGVQVLDLPPSYTTDSHDERATGQEELYVALAGHGSVVVNGSEPLVLDPGRLAVVPPDSTRALCSGEQGIRVLVIGGTPGVAYGPPEWTEIEGGQR